MACGTTTGYRVGCRCAACTAANTAYNAHRRWKRPTYVCGWCGRRSVSKHACQDCHRLELSAWGKTGEDAALTGGRWVNHRGVQKWLRNGEPCGSTLPDVGLGAHDGQQDTTNKSALTGAATPWSGPRRPVKDTTDS